MWEFNITERTEPFTLEEVFGFIDDTNIGKMDSCELKSRIVDVIQAERNMVIDDFAEAVKKEYEQAVSIPNIEKETAYFVVDRMAKRMKGGNDA